MKRNIISEIKIRPCEKSDIEKIHKIEKKSFPNSWPKSSFERLLLQTSGIFLVASNSREKILGYSIANVERNFSFRNIPFKKEGHVLKIAVKEEKRRKGLGTVLMKNLIKKMKNKGVKNVKLEVRVQNKGARIFYKNLGFEEDELLKNYYPNGANAVLMTKKIEN